MKKIYLLTVILVLICVFSALFFLGCEQPQASIEEYDEELNGTKGLIYRDATKYSRVIGYEGTDDSVIIPEYHNGLPVKIVEERAFSQCETIKSLKFNSDVLIFYYAFEYCTNLETIENLPQSVYDGIFRGCSKLKSVTMNFEDDAFDNYNISGYMFADCKNLSDIQLPEDIDYISRYAFWGTSISSINLPKSIKAISSGAFLNLKEVRYDGTREELKKIELVWPDNPDPPFCSTTDRFLPIFCSDGALVYDCYAGSLLKDEQVVTSLG